MKKKSKCIIISNFLFMILLFSIINTVSASNPTVGEIKLVPAHPTPQSDVTISTDIDGGEISKVRLIINECDKETGVCHVSRNISMSKKSGNTYEAKITLEWEEVTSITYHISLESDGKWIEYDEHTTKLSTGESSNDSNGSPGFEIIVFLIAIIGFVLYFRRFK
jgi:hypothetical protein